MINASGLKGWPADLQDLMFRHLAIQEACVIAAKDSDRSEKVKEVVALRPGQAVTVSEEGIMAWCRENIAADKAPLTVQFVEALPKTGSGTVMWRALQEAESTAIA